MKKIIAFAAAVVMMLSIPVTAFAQDGLRNYAYDVVINGESVDAAAGETINIDGATFFTAEYFSKLGVTEISAAPVEVDGVLYYSLRAVAADNNMRVFWDEATYTAIVINNDNYETIKAIIDKNNELSSNMERIVMELNGDIDAAMVASGESQSVSISLDGYMKLDINAPFSEMGFNVYTMGQNMEIMTYDDGEAQYVLTGGQWLKSESALGDAKNIIEYVKMMDPSTTALADDLSFAALKMTKDGENTILEGNMYVAETFKGVDYNAMVNEMMNTSNEEVSLNYRMPNTMYVKYVVDKDGLITSTDMDFVMGMDMEVFGESISIDINAVLSIPVMVYGGDFEAVVPQEVIDSAIDMNELIIGGDYGDEGLEGEYEVLEDEVLEDGEDLEDEDAEQ